MLGRISTGAQNDLERVTKLAYSQVCVELNSGGWAGWWVVGWQNSERGAAGPWGWVPGACCGHLPSSLASLSTHTPHLTKPQTPHSTLSTLYLHPPPQAPHHSPPSSLVPSPLHHLPPKNRLPSTA